MLALGLSLVFSEVCTPLISQCLRAPLLYPVGLVVLRDHTNRVCGVAATVYRREQSLRRFSRKLDSEDSREHPGQGLLEGMSETHLRVGKTRGYPRSYSTRSLALARDSLRGAPTKGEACVLLDTSIKILESSTRVCISLPCSLASAFTLIVLLLLR